MCSSWRVNAAKGGSCPPSWLKKAASRAENMADAKKFCKMRANWQKMAVPAMPEKITKKTGNSARAHGQVMSCASVPPAIVWHPLWQRQFLPPPFLGGGGVQDGLCHIHLNGEGPKKFRQQQGDWQAKLLESQRRELGRRGRVGQGLAAERGGNGAGAAPPQIKGRLLHKFCPTGQQGA